MRGRWLMWGSGLSIGVHWGVVGSGAQSSRHALFKASTHSSTPTHCCWVGMGVQHYQSFSLFKANLKNRFWIKCLHFILSWQMISFTKKKAKQKTLCSLNWMHPRVGVCLWASFWDPTLKTRLDHWYNKNKPDPEKTHPLMGKTGILTDSYNRMHI